jgi:hypothetical protein
MILISLKSGLFGINFSHENSFQYAQNHIFQVKIWPKFAITETLSRTQLFLRILINSIYGDCVPQQAAENTSQEHLYQG